MANLEIGKEAIEKKGWWQAYKWLILRRTSQFTILALFMMIPICKWISPESDCALGWIIKGNLSSSKFMNTIPMTDPLLFLQMIASGFIGIAKEAIIGAVIIFVFYLLVGGRVFCSWVCPVNIVTDAAFWLRTQLGLRGGTRFSRHVRYWMLGMVLLVSAITGSLAYELINPVSMLHRGLFYGMGLGWFVIAGVFLFDLFVTKRGWCTHICPMGAFYGLLGKLSPVRVRADAREKCDDCAECYVVCPESQIIKPVLKGEKIGIPPVILAGECTNCGRCIDVCAENVFEFGSRFKKDSQKNKFN
ncbi:MAG TPA: quinol dehydrogenase ferredoxin subunit NapH [Gammaproteobacteria bacterium]|nr:quinol dehydrogenase ferredoxin subunit NapH [Gammaproteobacteria bacterium]